MTKKHLILMLFLVSFFKLTFSQTKIGLISGLNFSTIIYNNEYNENLIKPYRKIKTGIKAGAFLFQELNPIIYIYSELEYSRKGLKYEQPNTRVGKNILNYAQWSASGNMIIIDNHKYSLSAGIGIYTALWLNGKNTYTNLRTGESGSEKTDFHNPDYEYNRWDAGVTATLSYSKKKRPWFLTVKFENGMVDSSRKVADNFTNRLISFSYGYILFPNKF